MAKLTMTLDTETQETTIDVDGNAVSNVSEVVVSNWGYDDKPKFSFSVTTFEKVGGVSKFTRLIASDSEVAKAAIATGTTKKSKKFPGFIEVPTKTPAQQAIGDLWNKTKKS